MTTDCLGSSLDLDLELVRCTGDECDRPVTGVRSRREKLCASCSYKRRNTVDSVNRPRRRRVKPPFGEPRASTVPEQIIDLDHAIAELVTARPELLAIPPGLKRYERLQMTLEPMSRLDLVVRFLEGIMRRNGWHRQAEP